MSKKKQSIEETMQGAEGQEPDMNLMQDKYMQMQMYDQQMGQLQKYIETFDEQIIGVKALIEAIKEFGNLKKGDLINAPLANGIFVKAKLEDSQNLLVNVGNGVVVSKTIPEVITMLESQEVEVKEFKAQTLKQMETMMKAMENFEK